MKASSFSFAEGATEFLRDVAFDIKEAVGKQLVGHFDEVSQLEGINAGLREGRIALGVGTVLGSPRRLRVTICHRDLALVPVWCDLAPTVRMSCFH